MQALADSIVNILDDYHNYDGFQFTRQHILNWVNQFDEINQEFILQEFLHILKKGIYVSEARAKTLLENEITFLAKKYNYKNISSFLVNVEFLNLQPENKSQHVLLNMMDEILIEKLNFGVNQCGSTSKKFAIYLDDILATGKTVFDDLCEWFQLQNDDKETNLDKVLTDKKIVTVVPFCLHRWGADNIRWMFKFKFKTNAIVDKIHYCYSYEVQNHRKNHATQSFNFAYPVADQPEAVITYWNNMPESANKNEEYAFRPPYAPLAENFFSSSGNRIRFENVILAEGVKILGRAGHLNINQRPLGMTNPSHRTLGTGTLFFTWRNISNTTPIVFWWDNNGWHPLFPIINRGH